MASDILLGMEKAYRLLSIRDRSVEEIRKGLEKKKFDAKTIETVVRNLVEEGYLDDEKFARSYAGYLRRTRRVGPKYVLKQLVSKGISGQSAKQAVDETYFDQSETDKEIEGWIERKLSSIKKEVPKLKKKKRIYDFLLGKGFHPEAVFRAMERMGL